MQLNGSSLTDKSCHDTQDSSETPGDDMPMDTAQELSPSDFSPLDPEEVALYISRGGPLSCMDGHFEERPGQIGLLRNVCIAFNDFKIGVFEAGTGVGKSYAYLLPAMLWALRNKERVVISTGTINLQQQLIEKDIPAAQKIIGKRIKAVLVKGRQNYVCLRRLEDARMEPDLFGADPEILERLGEWAMTSGTGSKSDLSFLPPDSVWTLVNSESDGCLGGRCKFRESCFVLKARRQASDAGILVVNHHLLFADIESRMSGAGYDDAAVLPPYRRLVLDEAHGIEDSATSFFSESITRFKVMKQISLLYRRRGGTAAGFLVQITALSAAADSMDKAAAEINAVKEILSELDVIGLEDMGDEFTARIQPAVAERFTNTLAVLGRLRTSLGRFTGFVREVIDGIAEDDRDVPCVWEARTVLRRLEGIVRLAKDFIEWSEHEDTVFYLERMRLPPRRAGEAPVTFIQLVKTPLDIAPLMNTGVFEPMRSVVCTSATLRTGASFGYWMRRTGISFIEDGRLLEGAYESPFPYSTNALFAVTKDAPFPDSRMFQSYIEASLPKLILASGGRTLVLFTSYESLRGAYNSCMSPLAAGGITLLKQGDDDRFRLLENFRDDRTSVLFATDSFWEGVDVPGESLSQVIIAKLPFAVPNDPVFEARAEAVEKRGGSSFMELSVPQAVIKFRQGFGRLLRRGDDKGAVVVLDRRIVEKAYGRQFTGSIPPARRMYAPLDEIVGAVRDFLGLKRA